MIAALNSVIQAAIESCENRWANRIERARELQETYREAGPLLRFYGTILQFQRELACSARSGVRAELGLREQIDLSLARERLSSLLALVIEAGPEFLASKAKAFQQSSREDHCLLLQQAVLSADFPEDAAGSFLARTCLQPLAENLQSQLPEAEDQFGNACPVCGGYPQLAILRPEGDGGRRSLLCSFCLREWLFRRVVCPWCGEEDKEKLPYYSSENCQHVRIQGCDTCHRYLKAVDMTVNGNAVPLVDEAALAVLDVWAVNHGYSKLVHNLIGM